MLCILVFKVIEMTIFDHLNIMRHLSVLPLFVILLTNGAFMFYSTFYYKKSSYEPIPIRRLTNIYVFSLLSAGVFVTISDPEVYNQMMLFSLIMIVASSYFIIEKKQLLVSILLTSMALIIGLYWQQGYTEQFQKQFLYLTLLIPIVVYISGEFYRSYTNTILVQVRLMDEIKSNRQLTKELSTANYQLSTQASLDPMTGLFNRRALNEHITDLAVKADAQPFQLTVLMLDVDFFKSYNDLYGHIEGDKVLIEVAQVLQSVSQERGLFAARYGGEEFTLILKDATEETIQSVCEAIVTQVEQLQIVHAGSEVAPYVTVSLGAYSRLTEGGETIFKVLEMADQVLYDVKNNGRNGYQLNCVVIGE